MSNPVIDSIVCVCCNNTVNSNAGLYDNVFKCFTCLTNEQITKQNNWLNKLSEQSALIQGALTQLQSMDVLDNVNIIRQNKIILGAYCELDRYINN